MLKFVMKSSESVIMLLLQQLFVYVVILLCFTTILCICTYDSIFVFNKRHANSLDFGNRAWSLRLLWRPSTLLIWDLCCSLNLIPLFYIGSLRPVFYLYLRVSPFPITLSDHEGLHYTYFRVSYTVGCCMCIHSGTGSRESLLYRAAGC